MILPDTPEFNKKRILSYCVVGAYLFLGGCEYAVILPTALSYLTELGATEDYMLGFVISGYSITAAFAGLIGGRLCDINNAHTKRIAFTSVLIMAIGNIQYTLGISVWNILASRLLCGFGTAAGAAMLAEVCRTTKVEERTPILAICNATRQLGILIGPAFQLLLSKIHFNIGWYKITPLNAPGLLMSGFWLVFCIFLYFCFYNLSAEVAEMRKVKMNSVLKTEAIPDNSVKSYSAQSTQYYGSIEDTSSVHPAASVPQEPEPGNRNRKKSISDRIFSSLARSGQRSHVGEVSLMHASGITMPKLTYMEEFCKDTFVLLLGMVFTLFFCQVGVESVIPIVMIKLGYTSEFQFSLVYMAGGVLALVNFFGAALLSRYLRDTTMNFIGWFLMLVAQIWLMVLIPTFNGENPMDVVLFMTGIVILFFGYPIASVANTGLFAKSMTDDAQGLGQGLRRVASYVGLILGPLWATSTINKHPYIYLTMPCVIILIHGMMFAASYKNLRTLENQSRRSSEYSNTRDEESRSLFDN